MRKGCRAARVEAHQRRSHVVFSDDKLNSGGRGEVRDTRIGGGVLVRDV